MAEQLVEVEFLRSTRVGSTVYNGPIETDHGGGLRSLHPADKCGVDGEMATKLVAMGAAKITRRDIPATERIGANGVIGGDDPTFRNDALTDAVKELVVALRATLNKGRSN